MFSVFLGSCTLYTVATLVVIDFKEAQKVAQNDPIIKRGLYQCEIFEWDLVVLSKDIVDN